MLYPLRASAGSGGGSVPNDPGETGEPGQVLDVKGDTVASVEVTDGNLTPGTSYKLVVVPANLGTNPASPTDFIRGAFKCAAAGGSIADMDGGDVITSYSPELIRIPVGSTKLRVFFLLDTATPYDCKIYLSRIDA
jgi:hypothetical protein